MRAAVIALFVIGLVPSGVRAQSAGISVGISLGAPPGEAIGSVDVFYDQLAPYGVWLDDPDAGHVFLPQAADYVPYTNGHWEYTDVGFVWISDEPFAWATSHYGRWWYSDDFGRWVWVPDTTWGPSWVEWREYGDYLGWAPIAPDFVVSAGYSVPVDAWRFCPAERIVDTDVRRYYVPHDRVTRFVRQATPVTNYASVGSARVPVGPRPQVLQDRRVALQPRRIEQPRQVGRMQPAELQTATRRAEERRTVIQQQNQKRIEASPQLRQIQQRAATQQGRERRQAEPQRQPQPQREPQRQPEVQPQREPQRQPEAQPQHQREPQRQPEAQPQPRPQPEPRKTEPQPRPQPEPRKTEPQPQPRNVEPRPEPRNVQPQPVPRKTEPQPQPRNVEPRPEPQQRPQPQQRPEPQQRPQPQQRPEQQSKAEPKRDDKKKDQH